MLSPEERPLLVDLARAAAVGLSVGGRGATTFTLHLTALLLMPLGRAGADVSRSTDPLGVLQAIRNFADLIDILCRAGELSRGLHQRTPARTVATAPAQGFGGGGAVSEPAVAHPLDSHGYGGAG